MDPKTGAEWERVGVTPDVPVEPARALDVAHALALKTIAANSQDPRLRRILDPTRETIEAQATPRAVPAATLAKYVGEYEGGRTATVEGGRLMFSNRAGFLPDAFAALNDSTFAFGAVRIAFEHDGGKVRLRIIPAEGEPLTYARVK
jgi:hypothetical protein